jgi:hypothetical protein
MNNPLLASIRGIPNVPSVTEVNVRTGPGTNFDKAFQVAVGEGGLHVIQVKPDDEGKQLNGKIYQWFQLEFDDGQMSWVRDDLLYIQGDGTRFGYGIVAGKSYAFALTRVISNTSPVRRSVSSLINTRFVNPQPTEPEPLPVPTIPDVPEPTPDLPDASDLPPLLDQDRIIRTAFNITAGFEGGGYDSYQTYDQGIISYGRFQFTLQSGSLASVLSRYLKNTESRTAKALMQYQDRITDRDASLRDDDRLESLLKQASKEEAMKDAQDSVAFDQYWSVVYDLSIEPRGIKTPLGQSMSFDIGIQHGTYHGLFTQAEQQLGVQPRSRIGENGVTEKQFFKQVARVRRDILYAIANRQGLPGVKRRADFWTELVDNGDWNLEGDSKGNVNILGRLVQVRTP